MTELRIENVPEEAYAFNCYGCGKALMLWYNGGELDGARCCGYAYDLQSRGIDFVVRPDPTPAAPDPRHDCECMSCRAKRAFGYAIGCCPKKLSHGALCTCGTSSAAPDQAEGPQPDDIAELRAMADKFERETQVFLGYRNAERAALLRHTADELARLRAREIL